MRVVLYVKWQVGAHLHAYGAAQMQCVATTMLDRELGVAHLSGAPNPPFGAVSITFVLPIKVVSAVFTPPGK